MATPRAPATAVALWELHAATSLARLWLAQGKRDKARDLLAPIYNWFTEGLDTPILREARVTLKKGSPDDLFKTARLSGLQPERGANIA